MNKELDQRTLEEACKAVCVFCKEDIPYNEDREQHANLYHCKATSIRNLMDK